LFVTVTLTKEVFDPRQVGSNVAEMYHDGWFVSICRLGIVVLVLFSYPLQLHPCRASLDKVVGHRPPASKVVDEGEGEVVEEGDPHAPTSDIPTSWFVAETGAILVSSFIIALNVSKLDVVSSRGARKFVLPCFAHHSWRLSQGLVICR
jgi:amino acid permease